MKYLEPEWPAPKQIRAYTTIRESWGTRESEPWDNQSKLALETLFQIPAEPIWLTQTHSAIAIEASPNNARKRLTQALPNTLNRFAPSSRQIACRYLFAINKARLLRLSMRVGAVWRAVSLKPHCKMRPTQLRICSFGLGLPSAQKNLKSDVMSLMRSH